MTAEHEFAHKVRHHLNQAVDGLDRGTADRLFAARRNALDHHRAADPHPYLTGVGHVLTDVILPRTRAVIAVIGLVLAVAGISIWNDFEKAAEFEEIDSALLADDLPINAYLDKGFRAWLTEHSSQD